MDKEYSKLNKDTKKLVTEEKDIISKDKKRDKFVDAGKKAMKKKT